MVSVAAPVARQSTDPRNGGNSSQYWCIVGQSRINQESSISGEWI